MELYKPTPEDMKDDLLLLIETLESFVHSELDGTSMLNKNLELTNRLRDEYNFKKLLDKK